MAQQTIVQFVDDLDGTVAEDVSTVSFALDGVEYEIDLTEANAEQLRESLEEFIGSARRTGGRVRRSAAAAKPAAVSSDRREKTKSIRDWARQNGFELSDRGRIPSNVIEAFEQAHSGNGKKGKKAKQPAFSG